MEFILYGKEIDALVEVVAQFKCLGRTMEKSDDDFPEILQNISRMLKVWVRLINILR